MIFGTILEEIKEKNEYMLDTSMAGGEDTPEDPGEGQPQPADNNEYMLDNEGGDEEPNEEPGNEDPEDNTGEDNEYMLGDEGGDDDQSENDDENIDDAADTTDDPDDSDIPDDTLDDGQENELESKEKELFANLTEKQMQIKVRELRKNFTGMYDVIIDVIEKVKRIPTDVKIQPVIDFVNKKLKELLHEVQQYSEFTFETKTYFQNVRQYNLYLAILKNIEKLFNEISDKNK